jgi:hypothetical protein
LQVTEIHEMIYKEFPNFSIWNNIVHNPQHLALWSAPPNLKKEIEFKWKDFSWDKDYSETMDGITRFMNSREISELQISSNLDILLKTDKFRKESLFGSMPYLKRFFE